MKIAQPELPARRRDVAPLSIAHRDWHTGAVEDFSEQIETAVGRPAQGNALDRIPTHEVDTRLLSSQHPHQPLRIGERVVDARQEQIHEGDDAIVSIRPGDRACDDLCDIVISRSGNEPAANLLRRGMQRNRKIDRQMLLPQSRERLGDADRRDRDSCRREIDPAAITQNAYRLHHLLIVVQRLADSHEYDAIHLRAQLQDLLDDLTRQQIAPEPCLPGSTELTGKRTAHLR